MPILIVESDPQLGTLWKRHLERIGRKVVLVTTQQRAIETLLSTNITLIVLNVMLDMGSSALAVADFASYRYPAIKVVFVSATNFFSDGSIFSLAPNACAFLGTDTSAEDLAVMADHYAARD
jgi:DNA-binding response OmpR family regulator